MARIITNQGVEEVPDREFFTRFFGHPPKSREQREAEAAAFWAKHREECRRELEELRDRLCKQVSPELQKQWRAKWKAEDAEAERRLSGATRRAA